ncbi:DUF3073 domain-containing protein [Gordonia desulfuricans]|uniref:DUF3073 domain-containing protein n=1 Tax=Gordonia desulfuricans TaxID=89051 RepID=A0A7K3LL33_9ACTN|nr:MULTISPECIES: DUF3073 domain-containing protein [Gordonia]KOY49181.1 hypothetical protein ISGA_11895 [Gordonia sp. NB41Y]NDK88751.1 DUF3073 domain-containing protein [Gordonia desulfuricans]WLP89483.1 DUF3073 domain-containing protein [Gordonia sp. NB41Y]
MGRGRAKAKQTKVARQLKYSTPHTDFESLQRELSGSGDSVDHHPDPVVEEWAEEDEWRHA